MTTRTHDRQGGQPVTCYRRADYALRLGLYGLRVFFTGLLYYPLAGSVFMFCPWTDTDIAPVTTGHPPVWWVREARRGFLLLDSARQADSGFAE
jgi:hypothetical protein